MKYAAKLQIGNYLCFRCIRGLLKSKVCILVSHQLQYLNDSDSILCLHEVSILGINPVSAAYHLGTAIQYIAIILKYFISYSVLLSVLTSLNFNWESK